MRLVFSLVLALTFVGCKTTAARSSGKRANDNYSSDGVTQPSGRSNQVRNAFGTFQY